MTDFNNENEEKVIDFEDMVFEPNGVKIASEDVSDVNYELDNEELDYSFIDFSDIDDADDTSEEFLSEVNNLIDSVKPKESTIVASGLNISEYIKNDDVTIENSSDNYVPTETVVLAPAKEDDAFVPNLIKETDDINTEKNAKRRKNAIKVKKNKKKVTIIIISLLLVALCVGGYFFAMKTLFCNVTYVDDNNNIIQSTRIKKGEKIAEILGPEKSGFAFTKWQLNGEDFDFNKEIYEDIILAPSFIKLFNVSFTDSYGSVYSSERVPEGSSVKEPTSHPEMLNQEFIAWYLGDEPYDFSLPVNNDLSLRAVYKDSKKVNPEDLLPVEINVESVVLDVNSKTKNKYLLVPKIVDDEDKKIGFVYTSEDENIASVSETGMITAIAKGTTKITISSEYTLDIIVDVKVTASAKSISFTETKCSIDVGKKIDLKTLIKFDPELASEDYKIVWSTDNKSLLDLSTSGVVTGKVASDKAAKVTAVFDNGSEVVTKTIDVYVNGYELSIDEDGLSAVRLTPGESFNYSDYVKLIIYKDGLKAAETDSIKNSSVSFSESGYLVKDSTLPVISLIRYPNTEKTIYATFTVVYNNQAVSSKLISFVLEPEQ